MTETPSNTSPSSERAPGRPTNQLRRRILLWIPSAVFGSMAATLLATAYKFLRPLAGETAASGGWVAVGEVSGLAGAEPLRREIAVEHRAGWSSALRGQTVYVVPGQEVRVLSAVCPHEGCEVEWSADRREFLCPCHDSRFSAAGARLSGPAEQDLAQLPSRTSGGVLEIQPDMTTTPGEETGTQVRG